MGFLHVSFLFKKNLSERKKRTVALQELTFKWNSSESKLRHEKQHLISYRTHFTTTWFEQTDGYDSAKVTRLGRLIVSCPWQWQCNCSPHKSDVTWQFDCQLSMAFWKEERWRRIKNALSFFRVILGLKLRKHGAQKLIFRFLRLDNATKREVWLLRSLLEFELLLKKTRPSRPIRCDVWIVEQMRYPTDRPTDGHSQL